MQQSREDLGAKYKEPASWPVVRHFVEDLKRLGRKSGAGFYDYPEGGKKVLWAGLAQRVSAAREAAGVEELKTRLLYIQALETARCFEEGVLRSVHEADLGSILGWGFPAYTGGTLSFIDTVGPAQVRGRVQAPREASTASVSSRPRACWRVRRRARRIYDGGAAAATKAS